MKLKFNNPLGWITFIIMILAGITTQAQVITLSGTILCNDKENGPLVNVHVYNRNTKEGAVSDEKGNFSIKMAQNDSIIFSTVQHIEEIFMWDANQAFQDKNIAISMQQDTIWLDAVSVVGHKSYEEFERELIQLKLPSNDISLALPVINKYASQNASGSGAVDIKGSLTYLAHKVNRIEKRKLYTKKY